MYHGTNSSIQKRLPPCQQPIMSETCQNTINVEASPLLCKLSNFSADNFYEFAVVFYNYVIHLAEGFDRLDVVFDRYFKNSLKAQTRKGRGSLDTRVLQITHDVLYLAPKIVSIHSDVGNMHLFLCVTHDNCK